MTYSLTLIFDCPSYKNRNGKRVSGFPPSLNARLHWRERARINKMWRMRMLLVVMQHQIPHEPLTSATIKITKYSIRKTDSDNIVCMFKALGDGLQDAGVLANDDELVLIPKWIKSLEPKLKIEVES